MLAKDLSRYMSELNIIIICVSFFLSGYIVNNAESPRAEKYSSGKLYNNLPLADLTKITKMIAEHEVIIIK